MPRLLRKSGVLSPLDNAGQSITEWQNWYDGVGAGYRLDLISNQRAHDMIEGGLALLRMNQGALGGWLCDAQYYTDAYFRDNAYAAQGCLQTGHFDEVKRFIQFVDLVYTRKGHMGDGDAMDAWGGTDIGNVDVESPSEFVIVAGKYANLTGDWMTLREADLALRLAIE
jgi:hypothetical protein